MLAPAQTPPQLVAKLNGELVRILKLPDVTDTLAAQGTTPLATTPQETRQWFADEKTRWTKVVRESGFKLEQ